MSYLERVLSDGTNRDHWHTARRSVIGASDAACLSKPTSVHLYLASKLRSNAFAGNDYTRSGHRWEPMMLAWAGIPQNVALVHSPDEPGFAATPDGINLLPDEAVVLAECKAKHDRVVTGPTLGEWRQLAWQFRVFPEAEEIQFIWAELVGGEMRSREPKLLTVTRNHPKILDLTARTEPIARDLLMRLRAALEFERQLAA